MRENLCARPPPPGQAWGRVDLAHAEFYRREPLCQCRVTLGNRALRLVSSATVLAMATMASAICWTARETTTGLSSLPPGSIAAAVVEHETPIAPSASSRRRFVCSGVWCHQPPRDKTFSSDACVQLSTDRPNALFSRVRPPFENLCARPPPPGQAWGRVDLAHAEFYRREPLCQCRVTLGNRALRLVSSATVLAMATMASAICWTARETTTGLSSLPRGQLRPAVVEHETPIAPSASSRRRFVCSGVWCHQPPRDKTFSSDACVQLSTDRPNALFSRVRPPFARLHARPPPACPAYPCGRCCRA